MSAECSVLYGVYDTKDHEVCIGIMTAREIAEYFDCEQHTIYKAFSRGNLLQKRYELKRIDLNKDD